MALHRRTFLATVGAACAGALAGCAHTNTVLTMDPVTDSEVADQYAVSDDPQRPGNDVLAEAVRNGSATRRASQLSEDRVYAFEGAYYAVNATVVGEVEGTGVSVEVDYAPLDGTPANGSVVPLSAFEGPDRELLAPLFTGSLEDRNEGPDMGGGAFYTAAEAEASRLVEGDVVAIRHEGEVYPVTVETRPESVERVRYEATQVAPDAATLGAQLKEEHLFTLSGLSSAERDLVETAIEEGYYGGDDETFASVVDRFRQHTPVRDDGDGGQYLVRYEGTDYWADVYAPFVE